MATQSETKTLEIIGCPLTKQEFIELICDNIEIITYDREDNGRMKEVKRNLPTSIGSIIADFVSISQTRKSYKIGNEL